MNKLKCLVPFLLLCCGNFLLAQYNLPVIKKLSDSFVGDSALLKLPSGKVIIVLQPTINQTSDSVEIKNKMDMELLELSSVAPKYPAAVKSEECKSEVFQGTHRAKAKTTMLAESETPVMKFNDVKEAIAFLKSLGDESEIGESLSTHSDNPRSEEETYIIYIKKAYLYQVYREPDNDFHMIIGQGGPYKKSMPQLNIEVSGLPRDKASKEVNAKFESVRNKVKKSVIGDLACVTRTMENSPILLKNIKGSLFLDKSHIGDEIGRGNIKVSSSWEIHPVMDITITGTY